MHKTYHVYIMANRKNGTLYIGVTDHLARRVYEHREGLIEGFTKKYRVHLLVYAESCHDIEVALGREKQLKHWNRGWKIKLIEEHNPNWKDVSLE